MGWVSKTDGPRGHALVRPVDRAGPARLIDGLSRLELEEVNRQVHHQKDEWLDPEQLVETAKILRHGRLTLSLALVNPMASF